MPAWKVKVDILSIVFSHQETMLQNIYFIVLWCDLLLVWLCIFHSLFIVLATWVRLACGMWCCRLCSGHIAKECWTKKN